MGTTVYANEQCQTSFHDALRAPCSIAGKSLSDDRSLRLLLKPQITFALFCMSASTDTSIKVRARERALPLCLSWIERGLAQTSTWIKLSKNKAMLINQDSVAAFPTTFLKCFQAHILVYSLAVTLIPKFA